MARFLVQSAETFQFLHFSPVTLDVTFTPSLLTALRYGVVEDAENAQQLAEDYCDHGIVIDVDLVKPAR